MKTETLIIVSNAPCNRRDVLQVTSYTADYIGIIRTPHSSLENMPIQPTGASEILGEVIINPELEEGLKDLDGFSHIYLIYHLHEVTQTRLTVIPFMDTTERGVFATRSPVRPARLGLSIVELVAVEGNRLTVRGVDMLDGTPLLDIKPYIHAFDCPVNASSGWMTAAREEVSCKRSDKRFVE